MALDLQVMGSIPGPGVAESLEGLNRIGLRLAWKKNKYRTQYAYVFWV